MASTLYVLGHKNPDSDSVCSSLGYAALLRARGNAEAIAARQGALRRETMYILQRFGVPAPVLVTDVRPRVADVMTGPAVTVHHDTSMQEVGQILQRKGIRTVPVVDDAGLLRGVTGVEDFARAFISGIELDQLDQVPLSLENVVRILGGEVLFAAPHCELYDRVLIGAMAVDSMRKRLAPGILLVMGDRADAQRAAIEARVGALVVTGDHPVGDDIVALAQDHGVSVIVSPHHTFTTVRLIQLSVQVCHVMRTEVSTCRPDDLVEDVRERLQAGGTRSLVVADEAGIVLGIISRSNLLRTVRHQVVLVDHNERGQSVAGIEEADVVGVIDHHRVADFQTRTPPFMRLEPVGSTSTIVAKLYDEWGQTPSPEMAGVLLGGILADTLLFRGPTTTPDDRRVAAELARRAAVDMQEYGSAILKLASDVSDRSAEQLLSADFKDFSSDGLHFGIGVIETTDGEAVLDRRDEMVGAMARLRERGYAILLFAVIDILEEQTTILIDGHPEAVAAAFDASLVDGNAVELPGILSRKKHIVPQLGAIARASKRGR